MRTSRGSKTGVCQWLALLPMQIFHARNILKGIALYLRNRPEIELITGDLTGLEAHMRNGTLPIITMVPSRLSSAQLCSSAPVVNTSSATRTPQFAQVVTHNRTIGRLAAEHLLSLGLRHLVVLSRGGPWMMAECAAGFVDAARTHDVTCHRFTLKDEAWENIPTPFGVFAQGDLLARRVIALCRRKGLMVPADVAVVGCDNDPIYTECMYPELSSIDANGEKVGYEAARVMEGLLTGHATPKEPVFIEPRGLVPRESSSAYAVTSSTLARALEIVKRRAIRGLTVETLADELRITRRGLLKLFRLHLGTSVTESIQRAKLEHARSLLVDTDRTVADVCEASGFGKYQRFSRQYALTFGATPAQYRSQRRLTGVSATGNSRSHGTDFSSADERRSVRPDTNP